MGLLLGAQLNFSRSQCSGRGTGYRQFYSISNLLRHLEIGTPDTPYGRKERLNARLKGSFIVFDSLLAPFHT
jgi:hypothetical protein